MKFSVGLVHGSKVDGWFFHTMLGLLTAKHDRFEAGDHIAVRSGPLLSQGRGRLVGSFLEHTDSDALLMLDADQHATPDVIYGHLDAFQRLREEDPQVGILAGVTYISWDPNADILYPNIWKQGQHPLQMVQMTTYPKDSLFEIAAAGCSNMIIGREVLQTFADQNINPFHHMSIVDWPLLARAIEPLDDLDKIGEVMKRAVEDADQFGEDLSFCRRVRENGYKIMCHSGIVYGHSKEILLDEAAYDAAVARHTTKESR